MYCIHLPEKVVKWTRRPLPNTLTPLWVALPSQPASPIDATVLELAKAKAMEAAVAPRLAMRRPDGGCSWARVLGGERAALCLRSGSGNSVVHHRCMIISRIRSFLARPCCACLRRTSFLGLSGSGSGMQVFLGLGLD